MIKKIKLGSLAILGWIYNAAWALSSNMPSEVQDKTNSMESLIKWAITIGGIVVIGLCLWAIHKNKGQGGWVEYVCWALIALAMFVVLITWWVNKANSATASLVF